MFRRAISQLLKSSTNSLLRRTTTSSHLNTTTTSSFLCHPAQLIFFKEYKSARYYKHPNWWRSSSSSEDDVLVDDNDEKCDDRDEEHEYSTENEKGNYYSFMEAHWALMNEKVRRLGSSKMIEIPNGMIDLLIGKGGRTIEHLQLRSGAKIEVRDADPNSTRVQLFGFCYQIATAEHLINDFISKAEGGSGVRSRRINDQYVMQVPSDMVGRVIGKGGLMLQLMSGAKIQFSRYKHKGLSYLVLQIK